MYSYKDKTLLALVTMAMASMLVFAIVPATTIYAQEEDEEDNANERPQDREQGEHGSGAADETGKPDDPNHWGDSASDFGNAGIMGDHSREGSAPGDAPFDERDETNGRIGVGNNVGDGPSGHGACVDGDPDTVDEDCPGA